MNTRDTYGLIEVTKDKDDFFHVKFEVASTASEKAGIVRWSHDGVGKSLGTTFDWNLVSNGSHFVKYLLAGH